MTHRPADNPPGVEVHDDRQVEPAFPRADIGDIRNPTLMGGGGLKILIQEILGTRLGSPGLGAGLFSWIRATPQPQDTHQSGDPMTSYSLALSE